VRTELETALFDLDHGGDFPDALARARRAYSERKSIEGDDVLAGRCTATGAAPKRG
jgi:hypothetical protein